jgi:hypothetical protein
MSFGKLPAALIFVNNDLNSLINQLLLTQLFISYGTDGYSDGYVGTNDGYYAVLSGDQFDGYIVANPTYVHDIHRFGYRVLVIRDIFKDRLNNNTKNYSLADVMIFIKSGLVYIEKNNFGPPGATFSIYDLTLYQLLKNKKCKTQVIY